MFLKLSEKEVEVPKLRWNVYHLVKNRENWLRKSWELMQAKYIARGKKGTALMYSPQ